MSEVRRYAEALQRISPPESAMHRIATLVLTHGIEQVGAGKPAGVRYGKPKLCFTNALNLAMDRKDLVYMEGYGAWHIPTLHAWCVDPQGRVIDPTWRYAKEDAHQVQYLGLPIKLDYVLATTLKTRTYGVIAATGLPLLTDPPEAWKETRYATP